MVDYRIKAKPIEVVSIMPSSPVWETLRKVFGVWGRHAWAKLTWRIAVLLRLKSR